MHPLIGDLSGKKTSEIESTIQSLTKKYFSTSNLEVKNQILMLLEGYKEEMSNRYQIEREKILQEHKKDLDKLIRID